MRLLILSDLHLDSSHYDIPEGLDFDAIILAGDLCNSGPHGAAWLARPELNQGKPVLYVPGNHEFYSDSMLATMCDMKTHAENTPVHVLDRSELILGTTRFLGCTLWTNWQLKIGGRSDPVKAMREAHLYMMDYRYITPTDNDLVFLKPEDTLAFHERDMAWLTARLEQPFDGRTVVITHHPPHRNSLDEKYSEDWCSPAFVCDLPDATFHGIDLWVHGHTHTRFDYQVGKCRVICNPRGYRHPHTGRHEVHDFDPGLIVSLI